jgi:hypothetical protein
MCVKGLCLGHNIIGGISHFRPSTWKATNQITVPNAPCARDNPSLHMTSTAVPKVIPLHAVANRFLKINQTFLDWLRLRLVLGSSGEGILGILGIRGVLCRLLLLSLRHRVVGHLHLLLLRLLLPRALLVRRVMSLLKRTWRGLILRLRWI